MMSTRVVTIGSKSGGSGKTSTAVSVAAIWAATGYKVLLVDGDGQANATTWCGVTPEHTTGDVLLRQAMIRDAIVPCKFGFDVLGASQDLTAQTVMLAAVTGSEQRFQMALAAVRDDYDAVIIDCPGALESRVTVAAIVAASAAVSVFVPTSKEVNGVTSFADLVTDVAEAYKPDLRMVGVVPCRVPAANAGGEYKDVMAKAVDPAGPWSGLLTPPVRASVVVPASFGAGVPVPVWRPRSAVAKDYEQVAAVLAVSVGLHD